MEKPCFWSDATEPFPEIITKNPQEVLGLLVGFWGDV